MLSADAMASLKETEQELSQNNFMEYQFRRIHDHQYELFVLARGFGVSRMLPPRIDYLKRPPLEDIPFNPKLVEKEELDFNNWSGMLSVGTSDAIEHLHKASRYDFLDAESFGVVIEPQVQVVGFVEHGFHHSPDQSLKNENAWTIERLELVSLLKFEEPRVYVLDHLPRMDQLSGDEVPTRSLDEFEIDALQQLRTDKDIITISQGSEYRMLGSLRAAKQCLECHNVSRGELLGAFSYDLRLASKEVSSE